MKPELKALVLADHIYQDAQTGKKVIAGTFSHLWAAEFPTAFQRMTYAYIRLTGIHGKASIQLRYVDLGTNEILIETPPFEIEIKDPLASPEIVAQVPPLPMPHEGFFAFEVYAAGALIGSHRIRVSKKEKEGGPKL